MPWVPPQVPLATEVETLAEQWVRPYTQATHLLRTRDWLIHLDESASVEMRLAAMTHDIERMFPGGPTIDFRTVEWDSPFYLFPHALRSAEIVDTWLTGVHRDEVDTSEVRRLVALHEVGGLRGADLVQAADSLSFLETLAGLTREWVLSGTCTRERAAAKLTYSLERIRVSAAVQHGRDLLAWAMDQLPTASELDPTPSASSPSPSPTTGVTAR